MNGAEQFFTIERFVEKGKRAKRECALKCLLILKSRNKDDENVRICGGDELLELPAVDRWHSHVGDQTTASGESAGIKQSCCRTEAQWVKAGGPQQVSKRLANP
jgi:hypothetical protein